MPTTCGHRDSKGSYCRWGGHGKKYYYSPGDEASKERARKQADKQGAAAYAHGYTGKSADDLSEEQLLQMELEVDTLSSDVQSIIFKKESFTREQAVSWANSHGFKSGDVEDKENTYRLRQFPPEKCLRSGGMKELAPGVMAYICPISKEKSEDDKKKVPNPDEPGQEDNEEDELNKKSIDIPKTFEEIKENCYIIHKGKIAKIVKVLEK